jgi:RNA polymerase sigma-70 factor, ECF subfamily
VTESTPLRLVPSPPATNLVERIRSGDTAAEQELVDRHTRALNILLHRSVNRPDDAQDIRQDVFRIVFEKIRSGEVREPERISGFVWSVASHLIKDHYRRQKRWEGDSIDDTPLPSKEASPLDDVLRRENARLVRQVLDDLPSDRDREVLSRFYLKEESKASICLEFGLASLQFDQVLFRARQRYRILYEKTTRKK